MAKKTYQVRVQSGVYRGRLLTYPSDESLRPTMQRIKSSLFETIQYSLKSAVFIDLFAAAGGIGIEAISRGAAISHFVETNPRAVDHLRKNLSALDIEAGRSRVHHIDAMEFLRSGALEPLHPDVIFADPPYGVADTGLFLEFLDGIEYLDRCLIVLEHHKNLSFDGYDRLVRTKLKTFGQTCLSFVETSQE